MCMPSGEGLSGVCVCVRARAQWVGSERCACVCARAQWEGSERCACVYVPSGEGLRGVHVRSQWGGSSGDPHSLPLCL